MAPTTLTDLPPELLDHIATYLPSAKSVASLGRSNKAIHASVEKEKDAWKNFTTARFPTLCPSNAPSYKDVARTLTTLSKAWDRRAFVARSFEPTGNIQTFPGARQVDRWKRPRGQTIGFTPQLDCFEEIGETWRERKEVLAFSAGAEICVRQKSIGGADGEDVRWMVYRPLEALEGIDDVTSLHLLRPQGDKTKDNQAQELITGNANGSLQLVSLPTESADVVKTHFVTEGQSIRSSSIWQEPGKTTLLAANMGETRVSIYHVDSSEPEITPTSSIDIRPPANSHRAYRAWSTNFISSSHLAVGLGPSTEPIHIYSLTPSGLDKEALRKYSLQNHADVVDSEITPSYYAKKSTSSVYPIVPLSPASSAAGSGSGEGQVFLTGAHDGIVRLHDLRSNQDVERTYTDPTDESGIYSLLARGRETLVVGTSRHSLLKFFDMRMGAKAYSHLDATDMKGQEARTTKDWNLFLKPSLGTYPGRGGGNNWARRSAESSIYSLATPSPTSPYLYAGIENAVMELAFTSVVDSHPDPVFFANQRQNGKASPNFKGFRAKEVLDLSMYNQSADMVKLKTQLGLGTTFRLRMEGRLDDNSSEGLDERWKIPGS